MANRYSTVLSSRTYRQVNYRLEHIAIAEVALGKPLPAGAEVHHVDENKRNNARTNLVICENRQYHVLLHVRRRVLKAGGDPNTQRLCADCKQLVLLRDFPRNDRRVDGIANQCRRCCAKRSAAWYQKHRNVKSDSLCACGCGEFTNVYAATKNGVVRGHAAKFIHGHCGRLQTKACR